ncbi:MAG: M23 family metallopeptidase [Actinomycetes bacterium]
MRGGLRLLAVICALTGTFTASAAAHVAGTSPASQFDFTTLKGLNFVWPAQGTITTNFALHYHDGIDIGMLRSSTIKASAWGIVEATGYPIGYEGYGNVVIVRVSPTLITIYAHLASYSVRPGDRVLAGQPLGVAGCTGICSGTHLHFEVRLNSTPIDPMQFLG